MGHLKLFLPYWLCLVNVQEIKCNTLKKAYSRSPLQSWSFFSRNIEWTHYKYAF